MIGSLYVQTEYSMKNSTLKLERIFELAKENGWNFLGIADDLNLHALYKALKLSEKYQIPVIIGMKLSLKINEDVVDFLCYAKDSVELKHLIYLSSLVSINPNLEVVDLIDELKQVTVVLPSLQTIFNVTTDKFLLMNKVNHMIDILPSLHFGLSLQHEFNEITHIFYEIAKKNKRFILPTHQINYASKEEKRSYDILKSIENSNYTEDLQDKAFINSIEFNKIYYASTFYKITKKSMDNQYGARHRAAMGISELCDATTIIVSEETGDVKFVKNGTFYNIRLDKFQEQLIKYLKD